MKLSSTLSLPLHAFAACLPGLLLASGISEVRADTRVANSCSPLISTGAAHTTGGNDTRAGTADIQKMLHVAWASSVHDALIDAAFPKESATCRADMKLGSRWVDGFNNQVEGYTYMHAQRREGQSVEEAASLMQSYIDDTYLQARSFEKMNEKMNGKKDDQQRISETDELTGNFAGVPGLRAAIREGISRVSEAAAKLNPLNRVCFLRGAALHPIMDSTSPAHAGFAVWETFSTLDFIKWVYNQSLGGLIYPVKESGRVQNFLMQLIRHGNLRETVEDLTSQSFGIPHSEEDMSVYRARPDLRKLTLDLMRSVDLDGMNPRRSRSD
ncbi:MAG: hypothetical protein H7222_05255 [Methylotenera sp.]|nr:hypothetical protein [Oligoflexia bacterium]